MMPSHHIRACTGILASLEGIFVDARRGAGPAVATGLATWLIVACSQASQAAPTAGSRGLYALGDIEGRVSAPLISFDSESRGFVNSECGVLLDLDGGAATVRSEAADPMTECARLAAFSGRPLQVSSNEGGHPQTYYFREGSDGFSLINITPDH